jgi:hypothetical protein
MVVVANFSGTSFPSYRPGFPYAGTWHVRLNSDANVIAPAIFKKPLITPRRYVSLRPRGARF